jgi:hypothetical protein
VISRSEDVDRGKRNIRIAEKKENFATQSRRQPTSLSFDPFPITSVVLTPILTSFVVGLALVDGEHGGKKSRRSYLSALRISIDLVEIDLDRCEAWEQQQGLPSQTLSPTQHHPAAAKPRAQPNCRPASRTHSSRTLLPTRKPVGLRSLQHCVLSCQKEAQSQQARRGIFPSSGFLRVNSDRNRPIDLQLDPIEGCRDNIGVNWFEHMHQRGPAKLRASLFPTTISPSKHENTLLYGSYQRLLDLPRYESFMTRIIAIDVSSKSRFDLTMFHIVPISTLLVNSEQPSPLPPIHMKARDSTTTRKAVRTDDG